MTLSISTVTNSIAAISVSGVTIKDLDEIPNQVDPSACPILYPEPVNFITNLAVTPMSYGTAGSGYFDVDYDMTYAFLYAKVRSGGALLDHYAGFVDKVCLILDAILLNDNVTGCVDLSFQGSANFVAIPDPAGNIFHGCHLIFHAKEFE